MTLPLRLTVPLQAGELRLIRDGVSVVDVERLAEPWHATQRRAVGEIYARQLIARVRWLLPAGQPCPLSQATTAWLAERLAAYPWNRNTLRRVHSAWSAFFEDATRVHGLFPVNPMTAVTRPAEQRRPVEFYELAEVQRIVGAQPTPARRALFAILYGTGSRLAPPCGSPGQTCGMLVGRVQDRPQSREGGAGGQGPGRLVE